jgi:hypothetical protein
MRILFSATGHNPTAGVQTYAVRRVRFGLARFSHQIDHVRISLVEINSPHGDARVQCRIELKGKVGNGLAVSTEGARASTAIDEAVDRMRRRAAVELVRARPRSTLSKPRHH